MPRGDGSNVDHKGTNSQGNQYTTYKDGQKYAYNNAPTETKPASHYYNTGKGHAFYEQKGPDGYRFHENQNQGYRTYAPKNNNSGSSGSSGSNNNAKK
jgi:hypothetical protein